MFTPLIWLRDTCTEQSDGRLVAVIEVVDREESKVFLVLPTEAVVLEVELVVVRDKSEKLFILKCVRS